MQRSSKDSVMPIRVWKPEDWKPRRSSSTPIWARIVLGVVRVLSVPFRPIGWLLERKNLGRFRNEVIRNFEGAFPGRTATVVRWGKANGWPLVVINVANMQVEVWTHMGEFGGFVGAASTAQELRAQEAVNGRSFRSVAEVAEAAADAVRRGHAEHEVQGNSAQAGNLE
jgi:hypothetical protein